MKTPALVTSVLLTTGLAMLLTASSSAVELAAEPFHNASLQMSIDPSWIAETADWLGVEASDCCKVTVKGCGEVEHICVSGNCGSDAQKAARRAFEQRHDCKGNSVSGYGGSSCKSNRCTMTL